MLFALGLDSVTVSMRCNKNNSYESWKGKNNEELAYCDSGCNHCGQYFSVLGSKNRTPGLDSGLGWMGATLI